MNEEEHVLASLSRLLEEVRQVILSQEKDGLRPSQLRVIGSVPPDDRITVTELGRRVGMTKQGTGQFVTQLTELGFLVTEPDPADGRLRVVRRSKQGRQAIHRLALMLSRVEQDWAARVGHGRYATFRAVLDEIAAGTPVEG